MTPVKSSNIEAVGYNAETKTLTVQFKGGGTFKYGDVPENVHAAMMVADSVGKYFHKHIRSNFRVMS